MKNIPLFVIKIEQKDNYTFSIQWNDGSVQDFRLCDLQRMCPCARCADENTGKPLLDPQSISDDVKAVFIRNVGRYGLRIQFTTGCSMGIFSFDRLHQMKRIKHA